MLSVSILTYKILICSHSIFVCNKSHFVELNCSLIGRDKKIYKSWESDKKGYFQVEANIEKNLSRIGEILYFFVNLKKKVIIDSWIKKNMGY